eukprot:g8193.t1
MVAGALEQVLQWQPERIAAKLEVLTRRCAAAARALGLQVLPHAPHFLGIRPPVGQEFSDAWADAAAGYLKEHGIHVSSRAGCLRVAPHLYNTEEDIDMLLDALDRFQSHNAPTGPCPSREKERPSGDSMGGEVCDGSHELLEPISLKEALEELLDCHKRFDPSCWACTMDEEVVSSAASVVTTQQGIFATQFFIGDDDSSLGHVAARGP